MLSIHRTIGLCIALVITSAIGMNDGVINHKARISSPFYSPNDRLSFKERLFRPAVDPTITSDTPSCVIPFNRAGNLIVIKAKVDTVEGNFILDTGAPKLILNITYFRNYHQTGEEDESGGITGSVASNSVEVANLSFGTINYYRVEADRINLGHLENSKGIKILGLLGMQLFKKFEMIIDYEKNLIYLHLIGKKETDTYQHEMLKDTSAYNTLPVKIVDDRLMVTGDIAGKKLTFIIDTGAESNVLDSRLSEKIFENVNITGRVLLAGSGTKKIEALHGDMNNMKLGGIEMSSLPVLVTNLEKMCFAFDKCLDGMLGFDFLSLHKIGFNFVTRKMYIWK